MKVNGQYESPSEVPRLHLKIVLASWTVLFSQPESTANDSVLPLFFFLLWRALPYLRSMGKWTCAQRHLFATPRFLVAI